MIRLFRVFIPKSIVALFVLDILLITACFLLPVALLVPDLEIYLFYDDGLIKIAIGVATVVLGIYYLDLYSEFRVPSRLALVEKLLFVMGVLLISQAVLAYLGPALTLPRWDVIGGGLLLTMLFPFWRQVYTRDIYKGLGIDRVLFLGTDSLGVELAERIATNPQLGFVGIGFVDDFQPEGATVGGLSVLGRMLELQKIVATYKPDRIVVSIAERRKALPLNDLLDLRFRGIRIEEAATLYEIAFGRVTTLRLRPSQLIFSSELGPQRWNLRLQTIYSFVLAFIGLMVTTPILILLAITVKLSSAGPILYRQTRVGLDGVPFTLYKFRSMVTDAEANTGAVWAAKNDPRVTRVGGFLRRSRLDELPQLFNVLRGEMAIVGPRPERPEFVATLSEHIPFYRQRHCVKPGLTGWAQINYKYGETIEDTIVKLEYDLYYIKNISPSLDAYIMFHTAKVILFSRLGQ